MRVDEWLVKNGFVESRSKAQDMVRRGLVKINGRIIEKAAWRVKSQDKVEVAAEERYVSRAGLKLASFLNDRQTLVQGATVLDVGSSTGGFTDYCLSHGAKSVVCVDAGTDQLHPSLRRDSRVKVYEKTDIRDFVKDNQGMLFDLIVIDVSFVSLTKILPSLEGYVRCGTRVVAMVKPQFESEGFSLNNGVVKNNRDRRAILGRFEVWLQHNNWASVDKQDSGLEGAKGNLERFYLLQRASS